MFESLTERLSGVFGNLGRSGRPSEKAGVAALRAVRWAAKPSAWPPRSVHRR